MWGRGDWSDWRDSISTAPSFSERSPFAAARSRNIRDGGERGGRSGRALALSWAAVLGMCRHRPMRLTLAIAAPELTPASPMSARPAAGARSSAASHAHRQAACGRGSAGRPSADGETSARFVATVHLGVPALFLRAARRRTLALHALVTRSPNAAVANTAVRLRPAHALQLRQLA